MTKPNAHLIEALMKHLPPSASQLHLLDVNGLAGEWMTQLRPDVTIITVSGDTHHWNFSENSFDAVVAVEYILNDPFLGAVLPILRHGGRLIIANSRASMDVAHYGTRLEDAGYVRILIEDILLQPTKGVLMRGEKAHITADTHERIQEVASHEAELIPIADYKGRFVHLLIRQTPNKPPWRMDADEPIHWDAVTINGALLAFSSLPKAVSFMQPSVLMNKFHTVNKVAKFKRDVVMNWALPIILNPTIEIWDGGEMRFSPVNPIDAETPDE
ncbi:MAG: class I SAM-dependent methyltransferase [Anaerolineae bacterium]|jgi:hypothetical protein|nr:class I SAM-dependent methyltransferase [Anaerolineae bacterium]